MYINEFIRRNYYNYIEKHFHQMIRSLFPNNVIYKNNNYNDDKTKYENYNFYRYATNNNETYYNYKRGQDITVYNKAKYEYMIYSLKIDDIIHLGGHDYSFIVNLFSKFVKKWHINIIKDICCSYIDDDIKKINVYRFISDIKKIPNDKYYGEPFFVYSVNNDMINTCDYGTSFICYPFKNIIKSFFVNDDNIDVEQIEYNDSTNINKWTTMVMDNIIRKQCNEHIFTETKKTRETAPERYGYIYNTFKFSTFDDILLEIITKHSKNRRVLILTYNRPTMDINNLKLIDIKEPAQFIIDIITVYKCNVIKEYLDNDINNTLTWVEFTNKLCGEISARKLDIYDYIHRLNYYLGLTMEVKKVFEL